VIIKREKRDKNAPARSKRVEVSDIAEYVVGKKEGGEEDKDVIYRGARGFITDDFAAQAAEMIALAEEAVRSPMPVHHWVMSWHEGEQPTPAQIERAVDVLLERFGLKDHQVIYGLHNDTDNLHLHLAINMVHPETEKVVFVRNDFYRAQEVAALLEHEQGWQSEPGGWYRVNQRGELVQVAGPDERSKLSDHRSKPSDRAERMEVRTGAKSAQRIATEEGAPAMLRATSWLELHQNLARIGMRFERKGSGAILRVGEVLVKASQADRRCSIGALEKRLGPFEPPSPEVLASVVPRPTEPVAPMPAAAGWKEYMAERHEHYRARAAAVQDQKERFGREWMEMLSRHRSARKEALAGPWKGRGAELNEARSRLAAQQATEKIELKERRERAWQLLRERYPRFPSYEIWLRRERTVDLAEQWRHRDRGPAATVRAGDLNSEWDSGKWMASLARDIRDFEAQRRGWDVEYRRSDRTDSSGSVAFVDRGRKVDIFDHHDRATVLAALQLAAEKWYGKFEVQGDDRYKRLCVELAAEHRWTITNPELQGAMEADHAHRSRPGQLQRSERSVASSPATAQPVGGHRDANPPVNAPEQRPTTVSSQPMVVKTAEEAYQRHFAQVWSPAGALDVSRADALVAVRLRVTGYDQASISKAVRAAASSLRPGEHRDWDAYGERVARYAFAHPGSMLADKLSVQRDALLALEGRAQPSELMTDAPVQPSERGDKGRGGRGE
jgi:Relaxase/Mobilisation nuclease domain/Large polyvalent protein-associated domain 7